MPYENGAAMNRQDQFCTDFMTTPLWLYLVIVDEEVSEAQWVSVAPLEQVDRSRSIFIRETGRAHDRTHNEFRGPY